MDVPVQLRDLSIEGFKCTFPYPIVVGSEVTLVLRGLGELTGTIAWQAGAVVGAKFQEPIGWRELAAAKAMAPRI